MRLKQTSALLLASAMLVGSVGMMNPTEVKAEDATNTFTLTVPADTSITKSGWNDIGSVGVSNVSIASDKKISVTIVNGATGRTLKKTGATSKTVGYVIKKGNAETNVEFGTSLDFTANGTQAIGADVASFTGMPAGNYTDTITFTAKLEDKVTAITMDNACGYTLSTADLGAPSEFTVSSTGKKYYAYNSFISKTAGSNWYNARDFVAKLNEVKYDGHTDWMLINDADSGDSAIGTAWKSQYGSSTDCGYVEYLWSSVVHAENKAFYFCTTDGSCYTDSKYDNGGLCGFLVLRGPSNASAPTEVTYPKTNSTGTLSSENLGTATTWTYNGVTYDVYNEFIPHSSYTSWNDAMGFINALNTANYDGYSDWTLLSSQEMATGWYNKYANVAEPVNRGSVDYLWSPFVGPLNYYASCLDCRSGDLLPDKKSNAGSNYGFVVLRGPSNASAAQGVEYTLTGSNANGKKLTSTALLASTNTTTVEYEGKTYTAYNGYISETSGANWKDGVAFVEALNANEIDGRTGGWTLLTSKEMAYDWWLTTDPAANKGAGHFGDVARVWTGGSDDDDGYCADCDMAAFVADNIYDVGIMKNNLWAQQDKSNSLSYYGFVVLRRFSNASAATEVTYDRTDGSGTLSSANLGEPTSWTYDNTTYQVYNAFIPSSSNSSWNDAMGFINALNTANYDGHSDWTLLSNEMAKAWYNLYESSVDRGGVKYLWLSYEYESSNAYCLNCDSGNRAWGDKSNADSNDGFVVLRGPSNAPAATEVTYTRNDGTGTLSSANLGEPTSWTYNNTTYQVYNAFISSSSDSSWNDAKGFVDALNDANYDGHSDWTLLSSKEMANAYADNSTGAMPSDRGGVYYLWLSVEDGITNAYYLRCEGGFNRVNKSTATSYHGFVVLRRSSNAPAAVTYNKTNSTGTLSSENLGTATTWRYNGVTYDVYNEFIPSSSGSSWNDAMGFINALNTANYDGHNDWTLLSSEAMATAWYRQFVTGSGGTVARGDVNTLWSSYADDESSAFFLNCNGGRWYVYNKAVAYSVCGFVVLRGSN